MTDKPIDKSEVINAPIDVPAYISGFFKISFLYKYSQAPKAENPFNPPPPITNIFFLLLLYKGIKSI